MRWFLIVLILILIFGLLLLFGSGAGYLIGSVVGAGQMDADDAIILVFLPFAILILTVIVFEIRMLAGWIALSRNQSIGQSRQGTA